MYCKECGGFNSDDSKFCKHCGAPLEENSQIDSDENKLKKQGAVVEAIKTVGETIITQLANVASDASAEVITEKTNQLLKKAGIRQRNPWEKIKYGVNQASKAKEKAKKNAKKKDSKK